MSGKPRILIVEDEIIIAREIEVRLQAMDYDVVGVVSSGEEGVREAGRLRPDLILMDVVLKGEKDGIEAAGEIRTHYSIPVIYLTAYTDDRTLARARITEPFGYVVKPFSERELRANIEMALYRHSVERQMRRLEHWFSGANRGAIDAVIAADGSGSITSMNASAEAITRWTREEAIGRPIGEVLRIIHSGSDEPLSLDAAAHGPLVLVEEGTMLIDRTEARLPVELTTTIVRGDRDQPAGLVSVFRDATGIRRGAIAAIGMDIARATTEGVPLDAMLRLCTDAVVRNLDAATGIWMITAGVPVLSAHSWSMGTPAPGWIADLDVSGAVEYRTPFFTNDIGSVPGLADRRAVEEDGFVSFARYPLLLDDRQTGVFALFSRNHLETSDVDSLASVARTISVGIERKRLEEQLRQAQKLESIGLLAGGVAHDFNNLLTIISGCTQLLLRRRNIEDEEARMLGEIGKASDRASDLTRQLLAFGRRQVLDPRDMNLNELVAGTDKMLRRLIGEDIDLSISLGTDLGVVRADPGQVEQIILNLAVNARDAMPTGGRLTVETANCELQDNRHAGVAAGNFVRLSITDTGVGMTPEIKARIFEPFFTTKEPGRGTGLGLATVYGIVHQSGGHIEVYSEPGLGTTFKVYFPRVSGGTGSSAAPRPAPVLAPGSETILVVEDEEAVRQIAGQILESCGYTVLTAVGGLEAMRILDSPDGDAVALVLSDVVMPNLSGRELMEQIRVSRPGLPILFMSGYTDDAVVRHGILAAEIPFVQKPFTPVHLAARVRDVLDAGRPQPPLIES